MIVKHIGADGHVRRTFTDVDSIYQHNGNTVVSVNRQKRYMQTTGGVPTGDAIFPLLPLGTCYEYPIAIINLAPGESLERVDDESTRN